MGPLSRGYGIQENMKEKESLVWNHTHTWFSRLWPMVGQEFSIENGHQGWRGDVTGSLSLLQFFVHNIHTDEV